MTDPHAAARAPLRATYRVQVNKQFTLNDARGIVPYLARLGISHLYCSPILAARPGSMHGYDVVDPTRINPEVGTRDDLRALAAELHANDMGILLDIVPNHMGAGPSNPYWEDVLAHGVHSRYAPWFDIDWAAGQHKIVLPVLPDELEAVLARGDITLDVKEKMPRLCLGASSWPVDPATLPEELQLAKFDPIAVTDTKIFLSGDDGVGARRFHALLESQHYRLTSWRRGPDEINYRRFFDVNDLVALRQEDPAVFAATHEFILALVGEGLVDGLRVDHVDGLRDPLGYLEELRRAVEERRRAVAGQAPFPIVVEKILSLGEQLRRSWPVQGTTGYEFLNDIEDVFLDPAGYAQVERAYRSARRLTTGTFADVAWAGKTRVLEGPLRADVRRVARLLTRSGGQGTGNAELLPVSPLDEGIVQFIAALPVYRTYVDDRAPAPDPQDFTVVERATEIAHQRGGAGSNAVDVVRDAVLGWKNLEFVQRLQQTSGPAAAKGVEDTALYVYVPLVSRNEVGGAPDRPLDDAVGRFHRANLERACRWPSSLTCVNTHDTKRSADVRARLDVLTECAPEWQRCVARWRRLNRRHRATVKGRLAPDTNTEYLVYQTLIGIWPTPRTGRRADDLPDRAWFDSARARLEQYMLKAVKEAKTRTSWTEPDDAYESALRQFIAAILAGGDDAPFLADVARFVAKIANAGHVNALARIVLQMTAPGVADTYQGDELWTFTLVDPDNRRPVDYAKRATLLEPVRLESLESLHPSDERLKLAVLQRLLNIRRERAALFSRGSYEPIELRGSLATNLVAFLRTADKTQLLVVAPRLFARHMRVDGSVPDWGDTELVLPTSLRAGSYRDVLRERNISLPDGSTSLGPGHILTALPMAVLLSP
ncbi:MAG TPA: malto-oligosyltrehalose synthase [Gemmatimonadaceae bacterium]|nr:malto-oligosyltrehalose synthase [Gemmatimonadaceae bacterium]